MKLILILSILMLLGWCSTQQETIVREKALMICWNTNFISNYKCIKKEICWKAECCKLYYYNIKCNSIISQHTWTF